MTQGKTIGRLRVRWAEEPRPGSGDCAVDDLRVRVPALASELRLVRHALAEWANRTPLRPDQVEGLSLACDEAVANVIEHAYTGNRAGPLHLDAICRLSSRVVTVTVSDRGRWQPPTLDPRSYRGRGLQLIRGLADSVQVDTGAAGTTVRMTWTLDQPWARLG